jgi:hypothetical protein
MIPKNEISSRDRLTVNVSTGEIMHGITFGNYLSGIYMSHMWWWILTVIIAVFLLYMAVLVPIAFVCLLVSPFKNYPAGVKRHFSGSYPHFIFCIIASLFLILMYITEPYTMFGIYFNINEFGFPFFILYIAGAVLYPFAHRSFEGQKIRRKRKKEMAEEIDEAGHVKYYYVTEYSDGSETSDYDERLMWQYIYMVFVWFVKMIFAPFIAYFALIKNYLFDRSPSVTH